MIYLYCGSKNNRGVGRLNYSFCVDYHVPVALVIAIFGGMSVDVAFVADTASGRPAAVPFLKHYAVYRG